MKYLFLLIPFLGFGQFNPIFFASMPDDANKFIIAAGITDGTQKTAIRTLVNDLKNNGLWTKMKAVYPMVGGTAASHKLNLKDPRDLDAAFRIVFSGTETHTLNGVVGGGDHDTKFNPLVSSIRGDFSWSFYSRTNFAMRLRAAEATNRIMQIFSNASSLFLNDMYSDDGSPNGRLSVANTNSVGHFSATKNTSLFTAIHLNGVLKNSHNFAPYGNLPNTNILLNVVSGGNCAFLTIGKGLTNAESITLYNIIQSFQTTLGRQI